MLIFFIIEAELVRSHKLQQDSRSRSCRSRHSLINRCLVEFLELVVDACLLSVAQS